MNLVKKLTLFCLFIYKSAVGQQDVDFHLVAHYLAGQKILKVYQNVASPQVWILGSNNSVYRLNTSTQKIDDLSNQFLSASQYHFIDIASPDDQELFLATDATAVIQLKNGVVSVIGSNEGLVGNVNSIGLFLSSSYYYNGTSEYLRIGTTQGWASYNIASNILDFYADTQSGDIFEQNFRTGIFANSAGHSSSDPDAIPIDVYTYSLPNPLEVAEAYLWRNGVYGHPRTALYSFPNLYFDYQMDNYLMYLYWGSENGLFENQLTQADNQIGIKHFLSGVQVNKINNILGLASFGSQVFKNNLLIGTTKGLYFSNSTVGPASIPPDLFITHMDDLGSTPINDIQVEVASITQTYPLVDCEDGAWVCSDNGLFFIKPDYGKYNNLKNANLIHFENQSLTVNTLLLCSPISTNLLINDDVSPGHVQWYKDNQEIPAAINRQLSLTDKGDYYAVVYDPCSDIHVESNHLIVKANTPIFTFNYPDKLIYCAGTPVNLAVQGSDTYQYRWYTNDALNGNTSLTQNITQSGQYKVEVSSCDGSWVASKDVQVDLISIPSPIIKTDKQAYCIGDNATLSTTVPVDPGYTINWYKDDVLLTAYSNQTSLTVNENGSYSMAVASNEINTDGTICMQTASAKNIVFNPPPTVTIQQIVKTTLCDGQTVDLKVSYNTGTVKWSTGQNSDVISINTSGVYSASVTSAAGCTTSSNINVQFFPNPILNLPNYSVCISSKKTATITAPEGMTSYTWNGQSRSNTFIVDHPQTVTLTITDTHGCQATQDIQILDQCPNILIPNAFTPNGDGINDTWNIIGLEYDPTTTVKIFTRNGQQIFDSKGYAKAWDGGYNGKQLPSGVYYYVIKTKNDSQTYSGSVTIIY